MSNTDTEEQLTDGEDLLRYLSPLLNCMRLSGLYFRTASPHMHDVSGSTTVTNDKKDPKKWNVGRIYSAAILVIVWVNAARMLSAIDRSDKFGFLLLVKLSSISATVLSALLQTACFVACRTGNLERIFSDARLPKSNAARYRRFAVMVTAISWLLLVIDLGFVLMIFFQEERLVYFSPPFQVHVFVYGDSLIGVKIMSTLLFIVADHVLYFSYSVNLIVTCILYDQFCTLNRDFQRSVGRSGEFQGSVREFRRRHQALTQSVENADQFMMISNVAGFGCKIIILILIFYCTIFFPGETMGKDVLSATMYVIWIVSTLFGLMLTACQGVVINHMVCWYNNDSQSYGNVQTSELSVCLQRMHILMKLLAK